jgi:hypothetical protein
MELADLDRLHRRRRRIVQLRIFRPVSDHAWANLLLFAIGAALLLVGLFRAFGRPQVYRGRIFGSIFVTISFLLFAFFSYEIFYVLKQVPLSAQAPRVGEKAPEFSLPIKMESTLRWAISFRPKARS